MIYRERGATDTMTKRGTGIFVIITILLIMSKIQFDIVDRNSFLHIPISAGQTTERQNQECHKKSQQFHRANITFNDRILFYTGKHYNKLAYNKSRNCLKISGKAKLKSSKPGWRVPQNIFLPIVPVI